MSAPRKTIQVKDMLDRANHYLATSPEMKQRERLAIASFVECLLHDTDAYAGFHYLDIAGVNYDQIHRGDGFDAEDESRRFYHLHGSLR